MNAIDHSLFMRAMRKQPVERTPVWIMRQAGRYLPEYRLTRQKAGSFLNLCQNPDLACEVTLQPLQRYHLDAAILFSDILTIPDALGLGLDFVEGEGPIFRHPVRDERAILNLPHIHVQDHLSYVFSAVRTIRKAMPRDIPLIGFSGSPWTLACYMIEGGSSRSFHHSLTMLYNKPEILHQLLAHLTDLIVAYLSAQVDAGANALMIFDTWGGLLPTPHFYRFSSDYMANIVFQLNQKHPDTPVTLFTKGGGQWLENLADTGCQCLGLDWTVDIATARKTVGQRVALQGNLDPSVLRASPDAIREQVQIILDGYGHGSGHIFNLGHGITPDIPPENVQVLVDAVSIFSPQYHIES